MWDFIKKKWAELSTKVGSAVSALALAWPQIQAQMPGAVQQLAAEYPDDAKAINVAAFFIGAALIFYTEKKTNG